MSSKGLKHLSLRLSSKQYDTLKAAAKKHSVSLASVTRLLIDGALDDLEKSHDFSLTEDGKQLLNTINMVAGLITELQKIRSELRRIGVNYNQRTRLLHIEKQRKNLHSFSKIKELDAEEKEIKEGIGVVDIDDIQNCMKELDAHLKKYFAPVLKELFKIKEGDI